MSTMMPTSRGRRGFTLIELLVVVSVILVIVGILLAGLARSTASARVSAGERAVEALTLGVNQFKLEFGFLPPLVHDGVAVASNGYTPGTPNMPTVAGESDWPVIRRSVGSVSVDELAVWSEADTSNNSYRSYGNFVRRRDGTFQDAVRPTAGSGWDPASAWDDRRYSKFSLAYYLAGIGPRRLDGYDGPGMSRPLGNGQFEGALFAAIPGGRSMMTQRDRYDPVVDVSRRSLRLAVNYLGPLDHTEHGAAVPDVTTVPDTHTAFIDPWGRAVRYYRWEPGRLQGGRLVVQTALDLNIPPVLINPEVYAAVQNRDNSAEARDIDLTGGSAELRAARFAVVSAGPDGLFGTEPIEVIAERLGEPVPTAGAEIASLRKRAWEDNIARVGN